MDGKKWKRAERLKLCKNAAEMTLFRRTLFSIFNLAATFVKALPLLVDQCPFSRKQNQTFSRVYDFFSVGEELTLLSLHGKI